MGRRRGRVLAGVGLLLVGGGLYLLDPWAARATRDPLWSFEQVDPIDSLLQLSDRQLLGAGIVAAALAALAALVGRSLGRPPGGAWWALAATAALILVGGAYLASPGLSAGPGESGWVAVSWTPGMEAPPGLPVTTWVTSTQAGGATVATLGLIVLAGLAGRRLGRP